MAEIVNALARLERSEPVRLAALWVFAVVLAVAFLALLIGDQVHAAAF